MNCDLLTIAAACDRGQVEGSVERILSGRAPPGTWASLWPSGRPHLQLNLGSPDPKVPKVPNCWCRPGPRPGWAEIGGVDNSGGGGGTGLGDVPPERLPDPLLGSSSWPLQAKEQRLRISKH